MAIHPFFFLEPTRSQAGVKEGSIFQDHPPGGLAKDFFFLVLTIWPDLGSAMMSW